MHDTCAHCISQINVSMALIKYRNGIIGIRIALSLQGNMASSSLFKINPKRIGILYNLSGARVCSTGGCSPYMQGPDKSLYDHVGWFSIEAVEGMTRRELQKWCKKVGIRANTKSTQMQMDLVDFHKNVLSNSDILRYPFLPFQINHSLSPYTKKDKPLSNNSWNHLSDTSLGQVRYFKNTSLTIDEECMEDAVFHTDYEKAYSNDQLPNGQLPSVSKVLRVTTPKSKLFAISYWTKKQKQLLGEKVFQEKMTEIKKKGSKFHAFIHQCFVERKLNSEVPVSLKGYLESTRTVFDNLGDAILSEKSIQHHYLGYQGKLDALACYYDIPCIIEWKTSQQRKPSLADCGDYPMQMTAYAGAINSDPTYGIQLRHGLLVIAYEDGSPADVHLLDFKLCRNYWQDWLLRLYKFRNQQITIA